MVVIRQTQINRKLHKGTMTHDARVENRDGDGVGKFPAYVQIFFTPL